MSSQLRSSRLRVAPPTLEPDPAFLGMLVEASLRSQPTGPRTARSAGLRMIVATASVAVIAAAAWAGGNPTDAGVPLSPVDRPVQLEDPRPPSPGDVGTPQPDVPASPGSPVSPGLPGADRIPGERPASPNADPRAGLRGENRDRKPGRDKADEKANEKAGERGNKSGGKAGGKADSRPRGTDSTDSTASAARIDDRGKGAGRGGRGGPRR